jgi:hypothetical protein
MYRVAAFQVPVAGFLLMVGMGRWLGVGRLGIGRLGVGQVVRCRAGGFDGLQGEHPRSIKSCFSGLFTFPKTTLK